MTILVSFYSGPGAGKTTLAASVFAALKMKNINSEYVPEFAKELTWQGNQHVLDNQLLVTGTQIQRLNYLRNKVDVIVTDSPPEIGLFYSPFPKVREAVFSEAKRCTGAFQNLRYMVRRADDYLTDGRNESHEQAIEIDQRVENFLIDNKYDFNPVRKTNIHAKRIVNDVLNLRQRNRDCSKS